MIHDPYDLARAYALIKGYHCRWWDEPGEVLAVEAEFEAPLVNPETGAASRTYQLGGKIDAIVRRDDRVWIVEHKTSGEDISPGSKYWQKLTLDAQVSTYLPGARALGFEPAGVLYDVIGKPKLRPLEANSRRAEPESPEAFGRRIEQDILTDHTKYFVRGSIVRLADEERDAAYDTWRTAHGIREARRTDHHPRNPESCFDFFRACEYFDVCSGTTTIHDVTRYREERAHAELADVKRRLPVISVSEMKSFRRCARAHHYRYDVQRVSLADAKALSFGTAFHRALEVWWNAKKDGLDPIDALNRSLNALVDDEPTRRVA